MDLLSQFAALHGTGVTALLFYSENLHSGEANAQEVLRVQVLASCEGPVLGRRWEKGQGRSGEETAPASTAREHQPRCWDYQTTYTILHNDPLLFG